MFSGGCPANEESKSKKSRSKSKSKKSRKSKKSKKNDDCGPEGCGDEKSECGPGRSSAKNTFFSDLSFKLSFTLSEIMIFEIKFRKFRMTFLRAKEKFLINQAKINARIPPTT